MSAPQTLHDLSSVDQLKVCRYLTRGEAPDDPALASITLHAGNRYQKKRRGLAILFRWWPMVLALCLIIPILRGTFEGQLVMGVLLLIVLLGVAANLLVNPWTRPKNVVKSMAEAKQVIARVDGQDE
jgi:hypothetical protein